MASRSRNPDVVPPSQLPLTAGERRRIIITAVIVFLALVLLLFGYWTRGTTVVPISTPQRNSQAQIEEEQLSIIRNSPVTVTDADQKSSLSKLRNQLKAQ